MRFNPVPFIISLVLWSYAGVAQVVPSQDNGRYRLSLKSGSFVPSRNIADTSIGEINKKAFRAAGKSFIIIQFEGIPTVQEKKRVEGLASGRSAGPLPGNKGHIFQMCHNHQVYFRMNYL